jgi:pimeloyl-ACP methyl ester carboxylesterase
MNDWFYEHALPRQGRDEQGRTYWEPETARELFFHDCTDDVARSAAGRLRAQAPTPVAETTPVRAFPDVPSRYVIGEQDRAVSPEWAAKAARERLGVEPVRIPGSHSPFLARPTELARLLASVTEGPTVRGGR